MTAPQEKGGHGVTEAMVERALMARVPGGSEVWVWIAQDDAFKPSQTARDVIHAALKAALPPVAEPGEPVKVAASAAGVTVDGYRLSQYGCSAKKSANDRGLNDHDAMEAAYDAMVAVQQAHPSARESRG